MKKHFLRLLLVAWCSLPAVLSAAPAPFGIQPAVSTNVVGTSLQLRLAQASVTNYPALSYRWYYNGMLLTDTARIYGTTTPTLTLRDTVLEDTGVYSADVLVSGFVLVSPTANVYIIDVPALTGIRQQTAGSGLRLIADATGGLLSYQWTWQGQNLAGATSSTLFFANAYTDANAGYYGVTVTNPLGVAQSTPPGFLLTKPALSGTYQGLFYDTNIFAEGSSGNFQFTVSGSKQTFSGKIRSGRSQYSFSGKFSLDQSAEVLVQRKGMTPLQLQLQLVSTNDNMRCFGNLTDGNWNASWMGRMNYYSSQNPTSLAGRYTVAFQNTNTSPAVPNGNGYGTIVVNSSGRVTFSGRTAEGTAISQSCNLAKFGDWPLWTSVTEGRQELMGWVQLNRQANPNVRSDSLWWSKIPGADARYAQGYFLLLTGVGSFWAPPANGPVIGFTSGTSSFFGGELVTNGIPFWDSLRVSGNKGVSFSVPNSPEQVTLSISRNTGVVSGSFRNPLTREKLKIQGVALPQQTAARGYYLGQKASGYFSLTP